MLPLSQLPVSSAPAMGSWLVDFAAIAAIAFLVLRIYREFRPADIGPQPLRVQEHSAGATVGDLDQVHGRIKRERIELDARIAELKEEDRRLAARLDDEISQLQDRVDAVPERTINLLRNTKGLLP